jgi:hypothetical protein
MITAGTRVGGQGVLGSCGQLLDLGFFFKFFFLGQVVGGRGGAMGQYWT